jgi:hypothetical protein
LPGGKERPWEWARFMTVLLRGERTVWDALMESTPGAQMQKVRAPSPKPVHKSIDEDEDDGAAVDAPVPGPFEYHSDGSADD